MKEPLSLLLWRNLFAPLIVIALCGILVVGYYGKDDPLITTLIWIASSIIVGSFVLRGEALPGQHRDKEMQRREKALAHGSMAKKVDPEA